MIRTIWKLPLAIPSLMLQPWSMNPGKVEVLASAVLWQEQLQNREGSQVGLGRRQLIRKGPAILRMNRKPLLVRRLVYAASFVSQHDAGTEPPGISGYDADRFAISEAASTQAHPMVSRRQGVPLE
jgi:hypothetical protein